MGNEQFEIINELEIEESEINNIEKTINNIESKIKDIIQSLFNRFNNIINKNKEKIEKIRKNINLLKKTPYDISLQNKIHLDKIYYIRNEYLKEYKKISEIFSKEMLNFLNKNHISEQKLFYEYSIHKKIDNNTGQINNICVLENNDFIICTKDKSLVIYNNEDYSIKLNKNNLEYSITYIIKLLNNFIATSSYKEILIIELLNDNKNYEIKQKIKTHENWINKLIKINNKTFLSCSSDKLIKAFNKISNSNDKIYQEMLTINIHKEQINSLCLINKYRFCSLSSSESILKIYSTVSFRSIKTFIDIEGSSWPDSICPVNSSLLAVCSSIGIYLINYLNLRIEKLLKINNYFTCIIKLNNDNFLCGKYYEDPNHEYHYDIYEFKTDSFGNKWGIISKKYDVHNCDINSIVQLNNNIIITASKDHNIIIWK